MLCIVNLVKKINIASEILYVLYIFIESLCVNI